MPRFAYVNGLYLPHADAQVHIEDRGFQFADGVYEVVACIDGKLADERGHLDRLKRSLGELKMDMPLPRKTLQMVMREVLRRNRLRNAAVYLQVTRGVHKRDFPFPPAGTKQSLVITARPFNFRNNKKIETGVKVVTMPDLRWKRRDIKTTALIAQVLAKQQAVERGGYESWLVDDKGFVTEGSSSNAWIVTKQGVLVTRPATNEILNGVTRTALAHLKGDIRIEERAFTVKEALNAAECFTSSAVALIMPVVEIDGKKIRTGKPGPVAQSLYRAYLDYVAANGKQIPWKA
jgi:D-alanine transaminase